MDMDQLIDIHPCLQFFYLPLKGLPFFFTEVVIVQAPPKAKQHHFFSIFGTGIFIFHIL